MRNAVILAIAALAVTAVCLIAQGPVPGDVAVTQALQSLFGDAPRWAAWLTDTAKPPMVIATVGVGAGLAWLVGGWHAAFAVPLA